MIRHVNLKRVIGPRKKQRAKIEIFEELAVDSETKPENTISDLDDAIISGNYELAGFFKKNHNRHFVLKEKQLTWAKKKSKNFSGKILMNDLIGTGAYNKNKNDGLDLFTNVSERTIIFDSVSEKLKWLGLMRQNATNLKFYIRNVKECSEISLFKNGKFVNTGIVVTGNCIYTMNKAHLQEFVAASSSEIDFIVIKLKKMITNCYLLKNLNLLSSNKNEEKNTLTLITTTAEKIKFMASESEISDLLELIINRLEINKNSEIERKIDLIKKKVKHETLAEIYLTLDVCDSSSEYWNEEKVDFKRSSILDNPELMAEILGNFTFGKGKKYHREKDMSKKTNTMSQNVDTKQNKIFDEKHKNLQKEIKNRKILKNNENVKPKSKDISISQQNPPQNRKSTPNIAKSQAKVRKRLPSKALSANKSTLSKSPKDLEFSLSEVQKWNPEKVSDWICSISPRFDEYRESFVKLRIHGDILLGCLTKNALAEVVDNPLLLSILWENIVNLRQILN